MLVALASGQSANQVEQACSMPGYGHRCMVGWLVGWLQAPDEAVATAMSMLKEVQSPSAARHRPAD